MTRLVDDLLDVGRIVSGKVHLDCKPVCLQQVAEQSAEAVEPLMRDKGHEFRVHVPEEPVFVTGDRDRLVQVLNNLLNNAAKFTPEGGRISLTLRRHAEVAELAVSDNGIGIPPDQLRSVFKLFMQGEGGARAHGGLGIGLGMAHQIVERHGGEISAFSSGEAGRGAEFVVKLPLAGAGEGPG